MKLLPHLRSLVLLSLGLPMLSSATDVIKTWIGANNRALNNLDNWNNNQRPTFGSAANTDALLFTEVGAGAININVDATAKSITVSGPTAYVFQQANALRLGDTTTTSVQPNSGFFINNSTARLEINTTGGLFFSFGKLDAVSGEISIGANTALNIGNGAATAGRNLTITGTLPVTVQGPIEGLGTLSTAGGHLIKEGENTLILSGVSSAWQGRIFLNAGSIRVSKNGALGSVTSDTALAGGDSTGRLELSGGVALDEPLSIGGRSSAVAPFLINTADNNVITTPILLNTGGAEFGIESRVGSLTIPADVDYGTLTGAANLHLTGASTGVISGIIGAGGDPLSIVKDGAGTWTLTGANAYTGAIQVNAGRLNLTNTHAAQNAITVADGAVLNVSVAQAGRSLNASSLSLSGTTGTALSVDLGALGNPSVPVLNTSSLTVTGVVGVSLKGSGLSIGQIPLIGYQGTIGGDGFAGLHLVEIPSRVTAALVNDEAAKRVVLNVTGFDFPRWTGEADSNWDINDGVGTGTGTFNWKEVVSGSVTRYLQTASSSDAVQFDDTAIGSTNVVLATALKPSSILVNNTTKNYVFTGNGSLEGTGMLTKKGTGTLTFLNTTANTFSGGTTLEAGVIYVGDGITAAAGSLGTGPLANATSVIWNRPDDSSFIGAISGPGSLIKKGAGTLTLSGNSNFTGIVNVDAGTLKLGNSNALGDTVAGTVVAEGAALDVGGQLLPIGEVVTVSGHGVGSAGVVVNTGTGGQAVGLKNLTFTGPSSIGGSTRWDVRDNPGGVNVNGHDLIKTGSNVVSWVNVGEAHIGNLTINGPGSRFTFGGNTTQGDRPGVIRVESGAQLGLEESTVPITKPIFVDLGTINATGGTTNVVNSNIEFTGALTLNSVANTEITFNGKITGDGSLTKTTGGVVRITSDQLSYPGTTTNSTGPLWLGFDTPTGKLPPGDIVNNGNLVVRRIGEPFTIAQNISGSGQITIGNANTGEDAFKVTLTGNNSFAGNVTVNRGQLHVHHTAALGATSAKVIAVQSAARPTLVLDGGEVPIDLSADYTFNTSSDGALGAIYNVSGNNIIRGPINLRNGSGGNTRIRSDGGSLTLAGNLIAAADATSARTLILDGSTTENAVTGQLLNGVGTPPNTPLQNLLVTKQGTGRWTLHGANTYVGATTISAGTLKLASTASINKSTSITLTPGATLDVVDITDFTLVSPQNLNGAGHVQGNLRLATGSFITPGSGTTAGSQDFSGNLTLAGGRARFSLVTDTTRGSDINDLVTVGGNLVVESASILELQTTGAPLAGSYRILEYTGDLVGDIGLVTLVNPTRYSVSLDTATDGQVNLVIGGTTGSLVWTGNGTTNVWDNNISQSWSGSGNTFLAVDGVTFDDSADPARRTVTLTGGLVPSFIHVNTNTGYTFSGTGNITGTASLLKEGTGTLTLNTTSNWQGKTDVRGGSIVLGSTATLAQTRWIELHPGTVLDVSALTAGLNFGNTADARILSGTGTVTGTFLVGGVSVVKPGLSSNPADRATAGDLIGALHVNGTLSLQATATEGSPRAVIQLGGATGHVTNSLDFESVAAFASTAATLHDQILVTGTLALDEGSAIRIELAGDYEPALGDVFNIADWTSLNLDASATAGAFDVNAAASFDLPELAEGLFWNRSLFTTHGILFVSPQPPVVSAIELTPGNVVNPGDQVTLSISAEGLEPYTYQWKRNKEDVLNATDATLTFSATEAHEGTYTVVVSNPAGPTTSAPVSLTVNDPVQFPVPPQSKIVNPNADVTFTVQVSGTGPFTYQWRKNGQNLENEISDTLSLISVTEADQALYDVVVTNVVGPRTSPGAQLSVNDLVAITQPPVAQGALLNGSATFSVGVSGTAPFNYRWQKNGVDISGSEGAQPTLTLSGVTEDDVANYSVRVSNIVGSTLSSEAPLILVTDEPVIISHSTPVLAAVGTAKSLQVNAVAPPPVKYQWFKGTAKIAAAAGTQAQLQLPNIQLKDAGIYTVQVTSGTGAVVTSGNISVAVVDTAAKTAVIASGGTTKLEVKTAGTGLTYQWQKEGEALSASARITGVDKNILTIGKPLEDADSGLYTLVVSGPGGPLTTLGHQVSVFSEAPEIIAPLVFPAAIVGGVFTPYTIPVNPDQKKTPTAYAAAGLPPGLKVDTKTGKITGTPTAVSKDPLGYLVKLTASNAKGKSIVEGRLLVQELPANVIGIFAAPIGRDATLNAGLGGRLDLTVTKTGTFTGKVFLGVLNYALKGALQVTPAVGDTASTQSAEIQIVRKGLSNLVINLTFDAVNNRISTATLTDGSASIAFSGWRNKWSKTAPATAEFGTYHTFGLKIPEALETNDAVPQGHGYGSFTVAADGKLSIAGKLADGEALTQTSFVGPEGEIVIFKTLYTTKEKGSIAGALDLDAPVLDGEVTWSRPLNPSLKHRLYQPGFPEVLTLTAFGGQYAAPVAPKVFLGLDVGGSATLAFRKGGIEGLVAALTDLDLNVTLGLKSKATLPANATVNPRKPTLTLTEKTGLIKGGFNLENDNPVTPGKAFKQAVKFEGVTVRDGAGWSGIGYYLLQQLPSQAVPTNTPILSGSVLLKTADQ